MERKKVSSVMIYEVNAKLLFNDTDEAIDFYLDCELALAKATTVNPGQPNTEYSTIEMLISNHDLEPNKPSVILKSSSNHPPPPE